MIRRIELLKLKREFNHFSKEENRQQIEQNVAALRNSIAEISKIEVVEKYDFQEASFPSVDLCVQLTFNTEDDYIKCYNNPIFKRAEAFSNQVSEEITGITYRDFI